MSGLEDISLRDIAGGDFEEDDDDAPVTASELLDILKTAWRNEKLSPELLPHKADVVDAIVEQVEQMEENVKTLPVTDLQLLIHRQELERIRYLVRSYLRTRLSKIERHSLWLYRNQTCLSPEEFNFLKEYVTATATQLKALADQMPHTVSHLNPLQMEIVPDFETHVIVKSRRDLSEAVLVQDGAREDDVVLSKDSQHIIPYSSVRQHVHSANVDLI